MSFEVDTMQERSRAERTTLRTVVSEVQELPNRHVGYATPFGGGATPAVPAEATPLADLLAEQIIDWWEDYVQHPWDRRKGPEEEDNINTVLEGFERVFLGETVVEGHTITYLDEDGMEQTLNAGDAVPARPNEDLEPKLTHENTHANTWADIIAHLDLPPIIGTAADRWVRNLGEDRTMPNYGNALEAFIFGEKWTGDSAPTNFTLETHGDTTSVIPYSLELAQRGELTHDNTMRLNFFQWLDRLGLNGLSDFLEDSWNVAGYAFERWQRHDDSLADRVNALLFGEYATSSITVPDGANIANNEWLDYNQPAVRRKVLTGDNTTPGTLFTYLDEVGLEGLSDFLESTWNFAQYTVDRWNRHDDSIATRLQAVAFGEYTTSAISVTGGTDYSDDEWVGYFPSLEQRGALTSSNTRPATFWEWLNEIAVNVVLEWIRDDEGPLGAFYEGLFDDEYDADGVSKDHVISDNNVWKVIGSGIRSVWNTVESAIDYGYPRDSSGDPIRSRTWTWGTFFENIWEDGTDFILTWWNSTTNAVVSAIRGIGTRIWNVLTDIGGWFFSSATSTVASIAAFVSNAWNDIKSSIQSSAADIAGYLRDTLDGWYRTAAQVAADISAAVTDMATETWVRGRGYITSLAGYATQAWVNTQGFARTTSDFWAVKVSAWERGSGIADKLHRLIGERFKSTSSVHRNQDVTISNVDDATASNTRGYDFGEFMSMFLTGSSNTIDWAGTETSIRNWFDDVSDGFMWFVGGISNALFGRGVFPNAYGDTGSDTTHTSPAKFIENQADARARHWYEELYDDLNIGGTAAAITISAVTPITSIIAAIANFINGLIPDNEPDPPSLDNLTEAVQWATAGITSGGGFDKTNIHGDGSGNLYIKTRATDNTVFMQFGNQNNTLELGFDRIAFDGQLSPNLLAANNATMARVGNSIHVKVNNETRDLFNIGPGPGPGPDPTPVNQPPNITSQPPALITKTQDNADDYQFRFRATDPESDTITWSLSYDNTLARNNRSAASITGSTFAFNNDRNRTVGDYTYTVTATATGGSDYATFTIRITEFTQGNRPPTISSIAESSITASQSNPVKFRMIGADLDGDPLTWSYRIVGGSGGTVNQITIERVSNTQSDLVFTNLPSSYDDVRLAIKCNDGTVDSAEQEITLNVVAAAMPPDSVTGLSATAVSATQIDLSWSTPDNNGSVISGFQIQRSLRSNGGWSTIESDHGSATTTSYSDTGVLANTRYYYRIRTNSSIGNSGYSAVVNATTSVALAFKNDPYIQSIQAGERRSISFNSSTYLTSVSRSNVFSKGNTWPAWASIGGEDGTLALGSSSIDIPIEDISTTSHDLELTVTNRAGETDTATIHVTVTSPFSSQALVRIGAARVRSWPTSLNNFNAIAPLNRTVGSAAILIKSDALDSNAGIRLYVRGLGGWNYHQADAVLGTYINTEVPQNSARYIWITWNQAGDRLPTGITDDDSEIGDITIWEDFQLVGQTQSGTDSRLCVVEQDGASGAYEYFILGGGNDTLFQYASVNYIRNIPIVYGNDLFIDSDAIDKIFGTRNGTVWYDVHRSRLYVRVFGRWARFQMDHRRTD